ncbi:hypothetical protein L1987_52408 [Smallanthus sonchifolius]|uniref:Uncharacterized protein n=1 Tax=Smallanthus sonchifolius TaxID=185202 RepID=A0ACB9ET36_9ASTR|nr:hypothetical protein L1987_52408 [Smallanthus sonchifolius]
MSKSTATMPHIVLIPDSGELSAVPNYEILEYEAVLAMGSLDFEIRRPDDECDPIALNYTSGTTSNPKSMVYSHRGAYLNSLAAVLLNEMRSMSVYLWTVPITIEMESVLFRHPTVLEAVVGRPDDHWGETSCAFVKLKDGYELSGDELIAYSRNNLPSYMAPQTVVFQELPKALTGKTQKFVLRRRWGV